MDNPTTLQLQAADMLIRAMHAIDGGQTWSSRMLGEMSSLAASLRASATARDATSAANAGPPARTEDGPGGSSTGAVLRAAESRAITDAVSFVDTTTGHRPRIALVYRPGDGGEFVPLGESNGVVVIGCHRVKPGTVLVAVEPNVAERVAPRRAQRGEDGSARESTDTLESLAREWAALASFRYERKIEGATYSLTEDADDAAYSLAWELGTNAPDLVSRTAAFIKRERTAREVKP